MAYKDFDYRDKTAPKLDERFKEFFSTNIKGKNAIKSEGLLAIAHQKGIWKWDTSIIQFPNEQNGWTAIAKHVLGGYDYDPIKKDVIQVEYSDIGDANPGNCNSMVKSHYIRMASTRAQSRTLRKYTNIDMVSTDELDTIVQETSITIDQLEAVKSGIKNKNISKEVFEDILIKTFGHIMFQQLTEHQGDQLLRIINNYIPPSQSQPVQQVQQTESNSDNTNIDSKTENELNQNPF